jgi:alkylation response protein AidB-like acyl-CoA dehydrogenase
MEFAFTEEQAMIAETARGFFAEHATSERTRKAMSAAGTDAGIDRELWSSFCTELGLGGIGVPEELGGVGLGMVEFALIAEAAGAQVAALPLLGNARAAHALVAGGTPEQQARWIPALVSGEVIATTSWAADAAGGAGTLSGTFRFAPHGGSADLLVLVSGGKCWLVEAGAAGVSVTPHVTMDQTRPLATIVLDNASAEEVADSAAAIGAMDTTGWLCLAAEALGGAQATLDRTVAYSLERVQFGRQIGSFQAYKHRLADMMIEIEQARSAVYWAACAVDEGSDEAALALHSAKAFCADTFHMCAGNMIQLHGGIGFTWEHDAHLFFKRARSISSMLGDSQWHREQIAAQILDTAA